MMTKEEIYDSQINPLMVQIIEICKQHELPFACQFVVDEAVGTLCTSCMSFNNRQINRVYKTMMFDAEPITLAATITNGGNCDDDQGAAGGGDPND